MFYLDKTVEAPSHYLQKESHKDSPREYECLSH